MRGELLSGDEQKDRKSRASPFLVRRYSGAEMHRRKIMNIRSTLQRVPRKRIVLYTVVHDERRFLLDERHAHTKYILPRFRIPPLPHLLLQTLLLTR